jgi:hypothetical protein
MKTSSNTFNQNLLHSKDVRIVHHSQFMVLINTNQSQVCLCKKWASVFYLVTFIACFSSENL